MSFGSKIMPRTFWCFTIGIAVLFILRSRLFLYYTGSGVNRVPVVLSGFSVRLLCFVQATTLCMYLLSAVVFVCVDVMSPASTMA